METYVLLNDRSSKTERKLFIDTYCTCTSSSSLQPQRKDKHFCILMVVQARTLVYDKRVQFYLLNVIEIHE